MQQKLELHGVPAGARVLVLEDEAVIAVEVEVILSEAGFAVAGSVATCAEALTWLDTQEVDVATLDMHVRDGSCERVAHRLVERGIPFVVFSGDYPVEGSLDPVFAQGVWLEKPASSDRIVAAVKTALAGRGSASSNQTQDTVLR